MRLARLDELRQAAKSGVEMRFEKEREELGTRVESRVQQAEANRMRLLKAHMQRRAAIRERTAKSLLQRVIRENKHKECVRSAIFQKRAAAEKKRLGLLEAEKKRAHARVVQARRVAKTVCWRQFVKSRRTTFALAKAYAALGLNENSVKCMPFEQVALLIESSKTLATAKSLLDRLESRVSLLLSSGPSSVENINHLLKQLASPNRRVPSSRTSRERGGTKRVAVRESGSSETKMSRYPVRVILCAYMILGHPNAVLSGQGEREVALREAAINFLREFELLVNTILDGPKSAHSSRQSSPDALSLNHSEGSSTSLPREQNFRCQLRAFDTAWCSYLYRFVVWKAKDARSLEEDLVRAACQLELSMMQTCKMTAEGQTADLTSDSGKKVVSVPREQSVNIKGRSNHVVRSLFGAASSTQPKVGAEIQNVDVQSSFKTVIQSPTENELLVNEIMHWGNGNISDNLDLKDEEIGIKVLDSGSHDIHYLGNILEFVLTMLRKLSTPASEDDMRKDHQKLLNSLEDIARSNDKQNNPFVIAAIKGLRFVLEQIQLEAVVSKTAVGLSELLKGSPDVGFEEITEMMVSLSGSYSTSSPETKLQSRKEIIARMLTKSLQNDDAIFTKVSRSIYMAVRGVVLGGSGARGRKLADAALRRIGAAMLLDQVVKAGNMIVIMAMVTSRVHGPWYRVLV
ncbi:hypothetical protein GW17_00023609 [Ensete ventricosum]|nr:hypothetical protein GW17_00023609 [Ensete ventricosum]RZS04796.1 hypothetical protein BHM03_00035182 [Ensete ventricosum]